MGGVFGSKSRELSIPFRLLLLASVKGIDDSAVVEMFADGGSEFTVVVLGPKAAGKAAGSALPSNHIESATPVPLIPTQVGLRRPAGKPGLQGYVVLRTRLHQIK